jgi:antitoxin component YwqK of YwqJK toxin-antitoxin module
MMRKSKKQFLFGRADNKEKVYEESKGIIREYYGNGQLQAELNYKDGKLDGICKVYSTDGQLLSEGNYKDGKQEGVFHTKGDRFIFLLLKERFYKEYSCPEVHVSS